MSAHEWDDFEKPVAKLVRKEREKSPDRNTSDTGCDWGQINDGESAQNECQASDPVTSKFIAAYERYLNEKKSLVQQTSNYKCYARNPQKELRDWFENEGHDFKLDVDEPASGQFVCSIDLPIGDQDFTLTSEVHTKKSAAIDEVCSDACRMLDDCQLLYTDQSGPLSQEEELVRKRRITEANKEDDIVFDKTNDAKRCRLSATDPLDAKSSSSNVSHLGSLKSQVNTYDSLMTRWTALNMNILQSKAKLVRLDLSVTNKRQQTPSKIPRSCAPRDESPEASNNSSAVESVKDTEEDDEVDPLDEFMSSLETKTKLSMDEKIEKSRLKAQIAEYERQQAEVARLLEVAKPSFDTSKIHMGSGGGGGGSRSKQ